MPSVQSTTTNGVTKMTTTNFVFGQAVKIVDKLNNFYNGRTGFVNSYKLERVGTITKTKYEVYITVSGVPTTSIWAYEDCVEAI